MSSSRSAAGAAKPKPHNVNSVYSGRNTAAGKASGPSKHGGLQALGKAPAVVRRMPPPATLPSLKAEHGQDPNVVLVPQGGTGWSKSADSVTEGKSNQAASASGGPDLRPNWAKPAPAATSTTEQSNAQAAQQPPPSAASAASVANNREFPTLAASVATAKGSTMADAKPANVWGVQHTAGSGNASPEVVTPVVPLTQAPSSGYIGASGPKNADRKLPERYYGGTEAQPRPAATKKYDIRQKLAQLSVESKEPPAEVAKDQRPEEKSATTEEKEDSRPAQAFEERTMPVFHPPDFSQPPPPVPQQNAASVHAQGQPLRPQYNQPRPPMQSQDVRQYSQQQHQAPAASHAPPADSWTADYDERHRAPPSVPPNGHGDTGYAYGQVPPPSGGYHPQQQRQSFVGGEADYQRQRGYDSRGTVGGAGGYPSARYEEHKPPLYSQQSLGSYADSGYGSGPFPNAPQPTGWGDEPVRHNDRSPSAQQPQPQRYRADSRGTSESESGWYAPIGRPSSYASNNVRPAETGWGEPLRPPSYPTPAPPDAPMERGNYGNRSRTASYNNAPNEGNYGGNFMGPGRDSAVDKSRQKRRIGHEPSNASESEFTTGMPTSGFEQPDQSASEFENSGSYNGQKDYSRRTNDRNAGQQRQRGGSQRGTQQLPQHQQPEQPAYRMLKRNDEKSAEYLAHHGGSFLPSSDLVESATKPTDDDNATLTPLHPAKGAQKRGVAEGSQTREPDVEQNRFGRQTGASSRPAARSDQHHPQGPKSQTKKHVPHSKDSFKDASSVGTKAIDASKGGALLASAATKVTVPAPPPENVWEKRMEERQKSAERENGLKKPTKHLEYHFPSISEAGKVAERLKDAEQEDPFVASQRQKYEHQDARYDQHSRRQFGGENQRQSRTGQWGAQQQDSGSRWDELAVLDDKSRQAENAGDDTRFEDNTYEGTRREFYNSRNRGVGRRAPATGVGLAGRVKRHALGRDSHRAHAGPRRGTDADAEGYEREAKPSRPSNEPEDSFANMGEFHAEDYAIADEPTVRGKGKKGAQPRDKDAAEQPNEDQREVDSSLQSERAPKRPGGHNGVPPQKSGFGQRFSGTSGNRNYQRGGARPRREHDTHVEETTRNDTGAEHVNGGDRESESVENSSQHAHSGPRRGGGRASYSDRQRGGLRKTGQFGTKFSQNKTTRNYDRRAGDGAGAVKSPITSDGAGEEWETASESSDFAERSGRNPQKEVSPNEHEHPRKRPMNRDRNTRARGSQNRHVENGDGREHPPDEREARGSGPRSPDRDYHPQGNRRPTGQKNAKPASHTYQDRNAFGKNNSVSAKTPSSSKPKPLGAARSGNSRAESVSNDSKNARDSRKSSGPSTASVPSVKDGLAGVDINDASVIIIDDHPDIAQSESHSEAGDFEEVLSKKSKKIRQQELEEERKREQRERERKEKATARKNRAQQQRAEKAAARKAERKSASEPPKEVRDTAEKPSAFSESNLKNETSTKDNPIGAANEQSNVLSALNGTGMDEFVATVWNSTRITAKVANVMESSPKVIPSPIARPTPKTSNASVGQTSTEKPAVEFAASATFAPLAKSGSATSQYDFSLDSSLAGGTESTELPALTESSDGGLLSLRPTTGIPLPTNTTTTTSTEHIQLQEKLDKVKDVWSAGQGQNDFQTPSALLPTNDAPAATVPEKTLTVNPSLSQAHGPNVAKVKPQPQMQTADQAQQARGAQAAAHDASHFTSSSHDSKPAAPSRASSGGPHPSSYLSATTHVPLTPQSPMTTNFLPQGAAMFGMSTMPTAGAGHNTLPPFSIILNGGEFIPQTFTPQLPANSPPSQFFGQSGAFAQRSRPGSFIESQALMMTAHPPPNTANSAASPWATGPSASLEMVGMPPTQPHMPVGPNPVYPVGSNVVFGNSTVNSRFAGQQQQQPFGTSAAVSNGGFSSQPPSRPPTAVSTGTVSQPVGMPSAFPMPPNGLSSAGSGFATPNYSVPPPPIGTLPPTMPPTHIPPPTMRPPQFVAGPFGPPGGQRAMPPPPAGNTAGTDARVFSNLPNSIVRGFPTFPPQGVIIRQAPPPPHHFVPNGAPTSRPPPHSAMPPRRPESHQNAHRARDSPSSNADGVRSSQVSAQTPPASWGAQKADQTSANSARSSANGFDLFKMNFSTSSAS